MSGDPSEVTGAGQRWIACSAGPKDRFCQKCVYAAGGEIASAAFLLKEEQAKPGGRVFCLRKGRLNWAAAIEERAL